MTTKTEQKHTPGPWRETGTNPPMIYGANDEAIAQCDGSVDSVPRDREKTNARRIVACVNALEGISTEELESGNWYIGLHDVVAKDIKQQRDELLVLLENAACREEVYAATLRIKAKRENAIANTEHAKECERWVFLYRAAIAKVKGA